MTEHENGSIQPPPAPSVAIDAALALAKGGLGCVPVFGAFGAEALDLLVTVPNQRRQHRFWVELCEKIETLRQQGHVDFDKLAEDESFGATVSAVIQAVNRTTEQEKLGALRAAVLNSTCEGGPTETMRRRFVQAVDELSPQHVQLLQGLAARSIETYAAGVSDFGGVFGRAAGVEKLASRSDRFDSYRHERMTESELASWIVLLLTDLQRFGFAIKSETQSISPFMGGDKNATRWRWQPSELGKRFLEFITVEISDP